MNRKTLLAFVAGVGATVALIAAFAVTSNLQVVEAKHSPTRALDEVASYRREALALLGGQSEQARLGQREAEQQLALVRADVEKKTAELHAMDEVRARLENDVHGLRVEVERLRKRGLLRR